jgi:hypothetical protein
MMCAFLWMAIMSLRRRDLKPDNFPVFLLLRYVLFSFLCTFYVATTGEFSKFPSTGCVESTQNRSFCLVERTSSFTVVVVVVRTNNGMHSQPVRTNQFVRIVCECICICVCCCCAAVARRCCSPLAVVVRRGWRAWRAWSLSIIYCMEVLS